MEKEKILNQIKNEYEQYVDHICLRYTTKDLFENSVGRSIGRVLNFKDYFDDMSQISNKAINQAEELLKYASAAKLNLFVYLLSQYFDFSQSLDLESHQVIADFFDDVIREEERLANEYAFKASAVNLMKG